MKYRSIFIYLAIFLSATHSGAKEIIVSKASMNEPFAKYVVEVIELISQKSEGAPLVIKNSETDMSQDRALQILREGDGLDLFWTMTSKDREKDLRVIRIPLLKGMLGNRIFIINKDDQKKFDGIKNFDDLKKMKFGQGHDWPDTFIFESAGLIVDKSPSYQGLFPKLASGRFDAFPRGLNEPWSEIEKNAALNLTVEKKIAVAYLAPLFFFVNPKNKALGDRVESGLKNAIADGSFEKLFAKHWGADIKRANMKKRKIFKIDNPFLSDETRKEMAAHPSYLLRF